MPDLLPRPTETTPILCPGCGHEINSHSQGELGCVVVESALCRCDWIPNDIAWWHLYGQLSRPPLPERPAPLPNPVVPDVQPRALRGLGGLLPW